MKFSTSNSVFAFIYLINFTSFYCVCGAPSLDLTTTIDIDVTNNNTDTECDALQCTDEIKENLICAASETGSIASFHSECGVNLINCYQRVYNAPKYHIISRKACAHKDILYMRGKCDKLHCENGEPEKAVCATNGTGTGLFKSACHIEILNCYQKIYARPQYRIVTAKNCANIRGLQ